MSEGTAARRRRPASGAFVWRLPAAALLAALVAAGVYLALDFAPRERARAVDRWHAQLSAMADDRRTAIDRWLQEGLGHARTVAKYPSVRRLAAGPHPPAIDPRSHLQEVLSSIVGNSDVRGASILDAEERELVSWGAGLPEAPDCLVLVRRAMRTGRPLADLHRHPDGSILLQFVAPVRREAAGTPVGAALLVADPEAWLYPFLRHQPLASRTEETLLVRRDGESVHFLSPLLGRKDPPLTLHVPIATPGLAASVALGGTEAFGAFVDYRGHAVLAETRVLTNAPWGLVAKVDRDEALAGVGRSVRLAALALSGLLVGLATALASAWVALEARARARLASAEARFAALLDEASDAILLVGEDGVVRDANRRAAELYGYTREALLGLHVSALRADRSKAAVEGLSSQILDLGERVWESVHVARDGRELPVEVAARAVEIDGERFLISIVRDVAARRRTEQALRESEARYRALFEANPDAVILAVRDGPLVDANPAALAMFGWKKEEIGSLSRNDLLDLDDPRLPPALEERRNAGRFSGFLRFRRRDGTTFEGELSSVLLPAQGAETRATLVVRDVTERRRSEEAVRASEARFRALFSNMLEGFAYCRMLYEDGEPADFLYVDVNRAFARLTGLEGVVGRRVSEVLPGIRQSTPGLFEAYGRVVATGQPEHFETFVPNTGYWFSVSAYRPEPGHFVAVFENTTERRKADEALRQTLQRLSLALEAGRSGVWEWDLATNENVWSEELWRLYGLEPFSCKPSFEAWRETILPEDRKAAERAVGEAARAGVELGAEWRVRYADGSEHWLTSRGRPIRGPGGEIVRYLGIVVDITDRKRAEEEIRRLNVDLERRVAARTAALEAANQELESFAHSVSHDLRAPLRAVRGFSHLLARDHAARLDAEALHLLDSIRANAERMDQLVADLLEFSRVGRTDLRDRRVSMSDLASGVVSDLTAGLDPDRLAIVVEPLPDVVGDAAMLRQVWVNLLSNALKFTGRRERARILVTGQDADGEAVYAVRDNGVGFDMRRAGKLFGVFHRLHGAQEFAGSGVGLAIVQRIVKRHGGRVWAEARADEGATFSFALPMRRS